jgi:hypothetical protein
MYLRRAFRGTLDVLSDHSLFQVDLTEYAKADQNELLRASTSRCAGCWKNVKNYHRRCEPPLGLLRFGVMYVGPENSIIFGSTRRVMHTN